MCIIGGMITTGVVVYHHMQSYLSFLPEGHPSGSLSVCVCVLPLRCTISPFWKKYEHAGHIINNNTRHYTHRHSMMLEKKTTTITTTDQAATTKRSSERSFALCLLWLAIQLPNRLILHAQNSFIPFPWGYKILLSAHRPATAKLIIIIIIMATNWRTTQNKTRFVVVGGGGVWKRKTNKKGLA